MKQVIQNIAPTDLRDYLKSKGWKVDHELVKEGLYAFTNPIFERRQLIFPIDDSIADYAEMTERVLLKLSEMEGTTIAAIHSEIAEMADDVIGFRVMRNDDFLPLGYALSAINGAKEMLLSAACSVLRPQIHHPRMNRREAREMVEKSRFRHTQTGSFTMKVSTPIRAMESVQAALFANTPFVRQATLTLNKGLYSLVNAVLTDEIEPFLADVKATEKPFVSSNLCKAIVQFQEEERGSDLFLNFQWARTLNVGDKVVSNQPIKIQKDYYSRIADIGQELKSQETDRDGVFVGTVEQLLGDVDEVANKRFGEVVFDLYNQEDESFKAKAEFPSDWYEKAIDAHRKPGTLVVLRGRILGGKQPRLLKDVTVFDIIKPQASKH